MKALDLYKFITDNSIEYHWNGSKDDVIIFVDIRNIAEFNALVPNFIMDESGIETKMKDGYFVFWMNDICESCDIELKEVFVNDER